MNTPHASLSPCSISIFTNPRKKPLRSGSRVSRSSASCTVADCMCVVHSARLRFSISASMVVVERSTTSSIGHFSSFTSFIIASRGALGIVQRYESPLPPSCCPSLAPLPDCSRALAAASLRPMKTTSFVDSMHDQSSDCWEDAEVKVMRLRAFGMFVLVVSILSALFLSACSRADAQASNAPPPPRVTVAEVVAKEVTEWDEFTGRLEAGDSVAIRPRVSGYVAAVRFNEGALVHRGDLLFEIDARPFQAEVDRLRAELARTNATVERAQSELARANRLSTEDAMSPEEHDRRAAFAKESAAQVAAVEA